ncbi:hypothetical protein HKX48_004517 [Thoreauomyces humboldtii]|nr:hypothetical protein HKX48_004517 [Thoreauomyces humboldtii]
MRDMHEQSTARNAETGGSATRVSEVDAQKPSAGAKAVAATAPPSNPDNRRASNGWANQGVSTTPVAGVKRARDTKFDEDYAHRASPQQPNSQAQYRVSDGPPGRSQGLPHQQMSKSNSASYTPNLSRPAVSSQIATTSKSAQQQQRPPVQATPRSRLPSDAGTQLSQPPSKTLSQPPSKPVSQPPSKASSPNQPSPGRSETGPTEETFRLHMVILRRIEREYHEDKAECAEIEQKHGELVQCVATDAAETQQLREEMERLQVELGKIKAQVAIREAEAKTKATTVDELNGMQKLLRRRITMRKESWRLGKAKADEMRTLLGPLSPSLLANSVTRPAPSMIETPAPTAPPSRRASTESPVTPLQRPAVLPHMAAEKLQAEEKSQAAADPPRRPSSSSLQLHRGSEPCLLFNTTGCSASPCSGRHACVACHGPHAYPQCTTTRTSCFRFNNEPKCAAPPCRREHRCLRCAKTTHRWLECPHPATDDGGVEFCLTWNSSRTCYAEPRCERRHQCLRCLGNHAVITCPENVEAYYPAGSSTTGDVVEGARKRVKAD